MRFALFFVAIAVIVLSLPQSSSAQTYLQAAGVGWRASNFLVDYPSAEAACRRISVPANYQFDHIEQSTAAPDPNRPEPTQLCYFKVAPSGVVVFWDIVASEWICDDGSHNVNVNHLCDIPTTTPDKRIIGASPTNKICCGNPIAIATGNKYAIENDYVGNGPFPFQLTRYYSSSISSLGDSTGILGLFGQSWSGFYGRRIYYKPTVGGLSAYVIRPDRKIYPFRPVGNVWKPNANVQGTLVPIFSGATHVGWTYHEPDGDLTETYDLNGNLIAIANRAGVTQTLSYTSGKLTSVTDGFGRSLTFTYNGQGFVQTITGPDSNSVYQFAYDASSNLTSVTYPDGKIKSYIYNEQAFTSNTALPNALTGIVDELNNRFGTYTYRADGLAIRTEHVGGVEAYNLVYNGNGTVTETDPLGAVRTYGFQVVLGVPWNTSLSGSPLPNMNASMGVNSTGYTTFSIDWNGNRTNFVRSDPQSRLDLETSRTEGLTAGGANTAATRTIQTTWHPTFRLPTQVTEKNAAGTTLRTTAMSYDTAGNMLTRTITDVPLSKSRTWTYTYNANGQVLTLDGPRTDISDVTTYTYYANNDPDLGKRANIATITNAAGQVTNITAYNAHSQPLTIVDPNGLATTLTYDPRQRLTSRTVGGETTSYTYDGVGQLTKVTMPDGSFLNYSYDAAHRLTQIADSLGNKIVYTLDAMGNRTKEDVFDPANALAQTRSRVYSSLNRLTQEIGASGQTTTYAYDNQGNVISIDGPLAGTGDTTTNSYDALNRLTRMTDPNAGQVNYGYNALDQMTSVSDPRNLTTSYAYDALNNLNQLTSPDTGATQNTYDNAGNLLAQTDAKGQVTSYTYDALNRVTSISYASDPGLNVSFTYDQGSNGIGRLTGVTDSTGTTSYAYEVHGRLISEARVIGGVSFTTAYSYDSAGRLASMSYPGGRQITYGRDALGRINALSTTKNSITQNLLNSVSYRPFGPEQTYTFGNGQSYNRGFDQDGRISSFTLPTQTIAVGYDTASHITALNDGANNASYNYDLLDRLTSYAAPGFNQSFVYDPVGNRTSQTIGVNTYTSTYSGTSNRIASTTGPTPKSFTFDANGSIVNDTAAQYTFDARGRMKQATTAAGMAQYLVNAMGQRVKKTAGGIDTVFHYDSGGRLISETDAAGNVKQEYVYLNDIPLAVLK